MFVEPKEVSQFIDRDELINYLPHKGKMFLLTRVTQHDVNNHTITTEYDITKDCIFYEQEFDGVPTWASVGFLKNNSTCQMKIAEDYRDEETHTYRYLCSLFEKPGDENPVVTAKITVMETEDMMGMFSK